MLTEKGFLNLDKIRLEEQLIAKDQLHQEKLKELNEFKQRLKESFQSLSLEALEKNNKQFLDLAKSTFTTLHEQSKGELSKKEQSIKSLVDPIKEQLSKLDEGMKTVEKERKGDQKALREHLSHLVEMEKLLQKETADLSRALRMPDVRGKWGELQLKRVVEMAGMLSHCDFSEQQSYDHDEGVHRPDLVVHLPGRRTIIVDSKAPFNCYIQAMETSDTHKQDELLQKHAKHLKNHIAALGKKSYWKHLDNTPEFVVLFLPAETFFSSALQKDGSLIEYGAQNNVILATPTTLIGLLRAIAYGWKQETFSENAKRVSEVGHELYKRLSDMAKHFSSLGKSLNQSVDSYNRTVGSFESRVHVSAKKLRQLGAASQEIEVSAPTYIEKQTRSLSLNMEE